MGKIDKDFEDFYRNCSYYKHISWDWFESYPLDMKLGVYARFFREHGIDISVGSKTIIIDGYEMDANQTSAIYDFISTGMSLYNIKVNKKVNMAYVSQKDIEEDE